MHRRLELLPANPSCAPLPQISSLEAVAAGLLPPVPLDLVLVPVLALALGRGLGGCRHRYKAV